MADSTIDLQKMKVPELKQALKDRGLPVSGTKPDLIKRLGEALGTTVDNADDGLEDSLQGIDDILNDDPVPLTTPKPPAQPVAAPAAPSSPSKPATPTARVAVQPPQAGDSASSGALKEQKDPNSQETTPEVAGKPTEVAKLSAEERLKMRAEKFGVVSADVKKQQRAERFGLPLSGGGALGKSTPTTHSAEELERMKKRAERFGTVVSTSLSKVDEEERKRKRAERFGGAVTSSSPGTKAVISINSTDPDAEAKKRKRAERFGLT